MNTKKWEWLAIARKKLFRSVDVALRLSSPFLMFVTIARGVGNHFQSCSS
jgi:hypothetical protein